MSEGVKNDQGKLRYDLYPTDAHRAEVDVLTYGAKKYLEDRNWERGLKWSRVYAAARRHMEAWWKGEDKDPESGKSHIDHARACLTFLSAYEKREGLKQYDDRENLLKRDPRALYKDRNGVK